MILYLLLFTLMVATGSLLVSVDSHINNIRRWNLLVFSIIQKGCKVNFVFFIWVGSECSIDGTIHCPVRTEVCL